MSAYFVTSTGTDIGKTFITAGLIRTLRAANQAVAALKPVVSGYDSSVVETSDPAVLLRALGRPVSADEIAAIAPWRFRAPLSPDLAAERENRVLDFDALVAFSRAAVAAAAHNAEAMGIVRHQPGVVFPRKRQQLGDRRQIAVHGKHAVGDD